MPHRAFDKIEVRCPQLGGPVNFGYCRTLRNGLPCSRALVCFELKFPVARYFQLVLREETFRDCFAEAFPGRYELFLQRVTEAKEDAREG